MHARIAGLLALMVMALAWVAPACAQAVPAAGDQAGAQVLAQVTAAQPKAGAAPVQAVQGKRPPHAVLVDQVNQNTVTIISGNPNGALLGFAYDLSVVLDDEDNLRILPIVGKGAYQNVRDILYLRGVDLAITQTNILSDIRRSGDFGPGVENRIAYITTLFNSEVHILAGQGIEKLEDLNNKKVNFSDRGSGSQFATRQIFNLLGIKPEEVNMGQDDAYLKVKSGEIAATIITAAKPVASFSKFKLEPGMKLLPVPYTEALEADFLPSALTNRDYPNLIKAGSSVETVAFGIVLIAYNWPRDSDRYQRIAKFTDAFFSKFDQLKHPPRQPKWVDVNLAAPFKGWRRFPAAQEWLDRHPAGPPASTAGAASGSDVAPANVDAALARAEAARAAPNDPAEQERLFQGFLEWARSQKKN